MIHGETQKVYWLERPLEEPSTIFRANADGSDVESVVMDSNIISFAVDMRPVVCQRTGLFADITGIPNSVEFIDISAVVDAFRGQPAIDIQLCDLYPCDSVVKGCLGDGVIDFRDVSLAINAFRGSFCE